MNIIQQQVGDVNVVQIEGNEHEIYGLTRAAVVADESGVRGLYLTPDYLVIVVKVIPPVPPEK